jgi:glucokinase
MIVSADIGGTKTLFAAHDEAGRIVCRARYSSRSTASFAELLERFLAEALPAATGRPRLACFGIAGPVLGERVKVTHLPWEIDAPAIAERFDFERVSLLNDFAAAAWGIDRLSAADLHTLQPGEPLHERPRLVIGAGTGLGVAYSIGEAVLSGEAGHASFAPADTTQAALWQWLHRRHGRVQIEHVVSGAGLVHIHGFLSERQGAAQELPAGIDPAAVIAERALAGGELLALAAVDLFLACFGALAGDHALAVLARGGVFLAGGIAPKLLPRLAAGGFLAAFNGKESFAEHTRRCPLHVVLNADLPLLGAAHYAQRRAAA